MRANDEKPTMKNSESAGLRNISWSSDGHRAPDGRRRSFQRVSFNSGSSQDQDSVGGGQPPGQRVFRANQKERFLCVSERF